MRLAIVGAGVAGRLLAWQLAKHNFEIHLFEKQKKGETSACSFAAAGILSPLAELEMAERDIYELGCRSMALYKQWLPNFSLPVFFRQIGSLVTAHGGDKVELDHFYRMIHRKLGEGQSDAPVNRIQIATLESDLEHLGEGLYLPTEGQIDPIGLMNALEFELEQASNVEFHYDYVINRVSDGRIDFAQCEAKFKGDEFDWIFDSRGLGAKEQLPLRGVRGELLWLQAPDVDIQHLTRLMHPRYRLYVVPRPDDVYLIGATEIESEDYSPVSVRSSLELLSAAYSIHRGFGEARIIKSVVNCRPGLPDNLPLVRTNNRVTQVNGLYRHGILLAPAVTEKAIGEFFQFTDKSIEKIQDAH